MTGQPAPATRPGSGRIWPIGIAIGLLLVALVNAAFVVIALRNPDPIVSTYDTEPR